MCAPRVGLSRVTSVKLYRGSTRLIPVQIPPRTRIYYRLNYRNRTTLATPRWSRCTTHEATLSRHTAHWSQPAAAACRVVAREHSPSNCDTTAPDCGVSLLKPALPQPSLAFLLVSPPNILPTDFRLCTSSTLAIGGDPALLTERHVPSLVRVQVDDILRPRLLPRCSRWHGCWRGC